MLGQQWGFYCIIILELRDEEQIYVQKISANRNGWYVILKEELLCFFLLQIFTSVLVHSKHLESKKAQSLHQQELYSPPGNTVPETSLSAVT